MFTIGKMWLPLNVSKNIPVFPVLIFQIWVLKIIQVKKRLLLLLLSHFSCVRLCATPEMAAHQAPPSLGFSRQVKSESEVAHSYLILSDPMDCSLPGSSIHGIFQARVLE